MRFNPATKATVDYFGKIKRTGYLAIIFNAFAVFGIFSFAAQSGGHGEMGRFYHDNMVWTLLLAGWAWLPESDCCGRGAGLASLL
jgi:hypothetical protein